MEDISLGQWSFAKPLIITLVCTGVMASWVCNPPQHGLLSWGQLLSTATLWVLAAAVTHTLAVWFYCRVLLEEQAIPRKVLIYGLWMSVAWLPLLVLLTGEHSMWTAGVPPVIAAYAAAFLRWAESRSEDADDSPQAPPTRELFQLNEPPPLARTLLPAVIVATALQAGVAMLAAGQSLLAGLLFALCTAVPVWTYQRQARLKPRRSPRFQTFARGFAMAVFFTALALIPYAEMAALSNMHAPHLPVKVRRAAPGSHYSGVILLTPPKPHELSAPSIKTDPMQLGASNTKPTVIPFDGVYWYFREPDTGPQADAPVVKGDPTKVNIRSTTRLPLSMDAHQVLGRPITPGCCSTLRVSMQNADDRPGAIYVEVILKQTAKKGGALESLGTLPLRTSLKWVFLGRPAMDEALNFPIPRASHDEFNEIVVRIKPAPNRSLGGAHVAVQQFELIP